MTCKTCYRHLTCHLNLKKKNNKIPNAPTPNQSLAKKKNCVSIQFVAPRRLIPAKREYPADGSHAEANCSHYCQVGHFLWLEWTSGHVYLSSSIRSSKLNVMPANIFTMKRTVSLSSLDGDAVRYHPIPMIEPTIPVPRRIIATFIEVRSYGLIIRVESRTTPGNERENWAASISQSMPYLTSTTPGVSSPESGCPG